jgi:hypothetical protein
VSGGSYNYAYSKLEQGDVTNVLLNVPAMIEKLDDLIAKFQTGEVTVVIDGKRFSMAATELRVAALGSARARLQDALAKAEIAETAARAIGGYDSITHDIEWWESGRWSADQVVDGYVERLCKAIGIAVPT